MCVHATVMRQSKEGCGTARRPPFQRPQHHGLPRLANDDVPLREEVVPIHDIRITFAPSYRFGRVHMEPEGQDLKVVPTPGGPSVVVPRLDIHSMVVAELAQ